MACRGAGLGFDSDDAVKAVSRRGEFKETDGAVNIRLHGGSVGNPVERWFQVGSNLKLVSISGISDESEVENGAVLVDHHQVRKILAELEERVSKNNFPAIVPVDGTPIKGAVIGA